MVEKLSPNFLNELFRTALRNKNIFEILQAHLEYHYLPTQEYKEIWKSSKTHFEIFNELPTIGLIAEQNKLKPQLLEQLNRIKEADVVPQNSLVKQIESYLRDVMFLNLYNEVGELRQQGKKEEAIKKLKEGAEKINGFSLQAQLHESVFRGFESRYNTRLIENATKSESDDYCCFGIDILDQRTRGGLRKGKTALFTALSGVGKSKILKWVAYSNARLGKRMMHFQFEGTKDECLIAYESMMSGSSYYDLKTTSIDSSRVKKVIENSNKVTGDIHVVAYEQFESASMQDVRKEVIEYIKVHGSLDGIVVDYLDEVEPGDGKKYSTNMDGTKSRKQAVAKMFTNLCVEFHLSGFIASQASDVPPAIWNDPKQVLTRSNIGGDKNLPNKFSAHITLNQTLDEKKNGIMRLYEDKYRDYPDKETHFICTAYKYEKFYDKRRTINTFGK